MSFSDPVFLFIFLPAVVLLAHVAGKISNRLVGLVLATASLAFYGLWQIDNLPLLLASLIVNFGTGQYLLRRPGRIILSLAIGANLASLGFYKYAGFAVQNLNALFELQTTFASPLLPLAISFFTFQQIAYLVDCYRRSVDAHDFLDYILFVTFFPHLVAGPLVQPRDMLHQWRSSDLRPRFANLVVGLTILTIGLFKKLVLADSVAPFVDAIFSKSATPATVSTFEALTGALGFTWQIYFDFSGYTDMAIGMALLFGVRLPINFASPYKATSIIEFWQRWHITLSRFLRDYLYYPLGGNRRGAFRHAANIMIVMLLGGLWHGPAWTFVAWGGIHGCAIVINHLWRKVSADWRGRESAWFYAVSGILTFSVVVVSWIFFRAPNWTAAQNLLSVLFGLSGTILPTGPFPSGLSAIRVALGDTFYSHEVDLALLMIGAIIVFLLPNTQEIVSGADIGQSARERNRTVGMKWSLPPGLGVLTGAFLFVSIAISLQTTTRPLFIYFQF